MKLANEKVRHLRYEPLRKQLQEISYWPHRYTHKVIGNNNDEFKGAVGDLLAKFSDLEKKYEMRSKKGSYLSVTFEMKAKDADEIISLWLASEEMEELIRIL